MIAVIVVVEAEAEAEELEEEEEAGGSAGAITSIWTWRSSTIGWVRSASESAQRRVSTWAPLGADPPPPNPVPVRVGTSVQPPHSYGRAAFTRLLFQAKPLATSA